jgi:hypothetical protein
MNVYLANVPGPTRAAVPGRGPAAGVFSIVPIMGYLTLASVPAVLADLNG